MKKLNDKKGISLIVLVITIIVMIVLASAIILSLSSSGIIGRANKATSDTNEANMLQAANVAYGEYMLERDLGNLSNTTADSYVKDKLADQGFTDEQLTKLSVLQDGTAQILPTIPTGFVVSIYEGEQKISDGLVVYKTNSLDGVVHENAMKEYDQYVWIPVNDINSFIQKDGYSNANLQTYVSEERVVEPYSTSSYTEEVAEYNKMKASVEKNGGFYIARYEAGKETINDVDTVVSKKDKNVWNNVVWGTDMQTVGEDGAVYLSRSIYPENNSENNVVSTLCYGVQWDAIMTFMKDVPNPNVPGKKYIEDSTGMGYYAVDENWNIIEGMEGKVQPTGYYPVKNIYDMAGNASEWTMETITSSPLRSIRGSSYESNGGYSASFRNANPPQVAGGYQSFRTALYLK